MNLKLFCKEGRRDYPLPDGDVRIIDVLELKINIYTEEEAIQMAERILEGQPKYILEAIESKRNEQGEIIFVPLFSKKEEQNE